jgi:hypothetical protein
MYMMYATVTVPATFAATDTAKASAVLFRVYCTLAWRAAFELHERNCYAIAAAALT